MRLAYFSPLPPQRSGIADYSRELVPHLAQMVELTLYAPDSERPAEEILTHCEVHSHTQFELQRDDFDLALYHIGNSEYHDEISRLALEVPGVVVLHDFFLHHAVARRTTGQGDHFAYSREMGYEQGADGLRRVMAASQGIEPPLSEAPLNGRLLDVSLGVIVHSHYTARLVRQQGYEGPLAVISAHIAPLPGRSRRSELNLPHDAVLYGSFGLISKEKQIIETLQTLRLLREEMPQAHYLLVGQTMPQLPIKETVRDLGLQNVVHHAGYAAQLTDFVDWIQTADVVINLRNPTAGETSATALRAMAAGKPLIVNDHGWYSEIPSAAALKIAPGDEGALMDALRLTGQSNPVRRRMGEAGMHYTLETCRPNSVADAYVQALTRFLRMARIYG